MTKNCTWIYVFSNKMNYNFAIIHTVGALLGFDLIWCPSLSIRPWWRYQMEIFSALLDFCAGNSPVPGEFPTQRPVTRRFDVYFDLRPNKRLSKQSWVWWFETLSRPLWRHRNAQFTYTVKYCQRINASETTLSIFYSCFPSQNKWPTWFRDNLFVHNIRFRCPIVLKFFTVHGSITVVLCDKLQNDKTTQVDIIEERVFAKYEFKMSLGRYPILHKGAGYSTFICANIPRENKTKLQCNCHSLDNSLVWSHAPNWGTFQLPRGIQQSIDKNLSFQ